MKTKHLILGLFATAITFTSCTEDEGVDFTPPTPGAYENGILITNEGQFSSGSGTVSYISNDFSQNEAAIYNAVNGGDLGSIVQSMAFYNNAGYVISNNSHKITVVDKNTFIEFGTIATGLNNPRYMAFANNKGYVTNWGDGSDANDDFIAVIDLGTNTVASTISITEGPEQIVVANGKLYVSHKGGFGQGNIVSVIDANDMVTTISVGDVPDEMVLDAANNIWVLCEGIPSWAGTETGGKLIKINTVDDTVATTIDFATTEHPNELGFDNDNLYYGMSGSVYSMADTDTMLPATSIITAATYAMEAKNGKLYTTDAGNYSDDGTLKVFDLLDNSEIQSITVGVIPGGIYFN